MAGLSFDKVRELIHAKVASQLVGTKAVISLGKLRAINVFLAGDVVAPGNYSVSGLSTVLQVLYAGGGVSEIGSLRDIQVKRSGAVVARLDAYDILLDGDTSGDIRLASGDTVFVPTVDRLVSVEGEVKRPAIYEVMNDDSLGDVLRMAGGLTTSSYAKSASIERRVDREPSLVRVQVDLSNPNDLKRTMFDGDRLEVAPISKRIRNQIVLRGAVARPGGYEWTPGMRVSDLLGSVEDDLLVETDLSVGLVIRRTGFGLEIEVLSLNLAAAIAEKGGEKDLLLKPEDELLVFAQSFFNESYQNLSIEAGSVDGGGDKDEEQTEDDKAALRIGCS